MSLKNYKNYLVKRAEYSGKKSSVDFDKFNRHLDYYPLYKSWRCQNWATEVECIWKVLLLLLSTKIDQFFVHPVYTRSSGRTPRSAVQ